MEATNKKERVINFGATDELMEFLNDSLDRSTKGKIGTEVKIMTVEIAKREINKIDEQLKNPKLQDDEWFALVKKLDKITDLTRWM